MTALLVHFCNETCTHRKLNHKPGNQSVNDGLLIKINKMEEIHKLNTQTRDEQSRASYK